MTSFKVNTGYQITILGSGTSSGVPLIGCDCAVCRSTDSFDKRLRASLSVVSPKGKQWVIDTGPDFRTQMLRENIRRIDAILYTHPHADHCHGIDDVRAYNFLQKSSIPLWGNDWTLQDLSHRFSYAFDHVPAEGGGKPLLEKNSISADQDQILLGDEPVGIIHLQHGTRHTLGFKFGPIAYITDCSYIHDRSIPQLHGLSVLILDCVRLKPHRTHLHLERSLEIINELKPAQTYLTHLGHEFGHKEWNTKLPPGVALAFDGLKISS